MSEQTKTCPTCIETKDVSCFSKDKRASDGLQSQCKACQKAHYKANKENVCAKRKTYHESNRDKVNALHKAYREANKDQISAYKKAHNQSQRGKYTSYKRSAKQRGIPFDLTFDEFITFWQQDCNYCKRPVPTIGIDRIDSSIGYMLENCVSCCTICNYMKLDYSLEEWQTNMLMALKGMGVI